MLPFIQQIFTESLLCSRHIRAAKEKHTETSYNVRTQLNPDLGKQWNFPENMVSFELMAEEYSSI